MGCDCVTCACEGVRCACDSVECEEVRVRLEEEVVGFCVSISVKNEMIMWSQRSLICMDMTTIFQCT